VYAVISQTGNKVVVVAVTAHQTIPMPGTTSQRLKFAADAFFKAVDYGKIQKAQFIPNTQKIVINGKSIGLASRVEAASPTEQLIKSLNRADGINAKDATVRAREVANLSIHRATLLQSVGNKIENLSPAQANYVARALDLEAQFRLEKTLQSATYAKPSEIMAAGQYAYGIDQQLSAVKKNSLSSGNTSKKVSELLNEAMLIASISI
jgi:hypothetical protein